VEMRRLRKSFSCAIAGLIYCIKTEKNMKIHILATIIAVIVALVVKLNYTEWGLLILTIFMVLVAETVNTAVEKTVDLVTTEYHPLAKTAKNLAAGAVLLAAIGSLLMAVVIFGPHIKIILNV
jgi:diacylglycerol kinase